MFQDRGDAPADLVALEAENRALAGRLRRADLSVPRSDAAAAVVDWSRRRDRELQPEIEALERELELEAETIGRLERRLAELRGSRSLTLLRRLLG